MAADRFGRKRVILLGFVLFAIHSFSFAVAGTPAAIWILFAFHGLFMGLAEGIQKAFLASSFPRISAPLRIAQVNPVGPR